MATTVGVAHGVERQCGNANCRLAYRYPEAKTFRCQACGVEQPWDGWASTSAKSFDAMQQVERARMMQDPQRNQAIDDQAPAIDLHAVHATLNQMSSDVLRQLHDRLAILQMVSLANMARFDEPELFMRIRQALAGAGVKF